MGLPKRIVEARILNRFHGIASVPKFIFALQFSSVTDGNFDHFGGNLGEICHIVQTAHFRQQTACK
jgi:hypothetical protein